MSEMQCGPQGRLLAVAWQVNLAGSGSRALAYFLTCSVYLPCNHSLLFMQQQQ
jgi:hypothetical protein